MQAPGLNSDTAKHIRLQLESAMLNVDIAYNVIDTCAISNNSVTAEQCQPLLLQLRSIKNLLMSVDTSFGHHLFTKFTAEATKYHNTVLYLPSPNANSKCNRIANDFTHEIDRITDILHDNTGYKWIDKSE